MMLNYSDIIQKLLRIRKSTNEVTAACVYGSRIMGTATENSDLDVYLITGGNTDFRGCYRVDGIAVEYFEKSFMTIMKEIEQNRKRNNPFYDSFFKHCEVVFDRSGMVNYLRDYHKQTGNVLSTPLKLNDADLQTLMMLQIELEKHANQEDSIYDYYYYTFLEQLRMAYHKQNGCTMISTYNTYSLYQDKAKTGRYCTILPNQEYRTFFLDCIENAESPRSMKQRRIVEAKDYLGIQTLEPIKESLLQPHSRIETIRHQWISIYHGIKHLEDTYYGNKKSFYYEYYVLAHQLQRLNDAYLTTFPGQTLPSDWHAQLVSTGDIYALDKVTDFFCEQLDCNPEEYEIPYFRKNYRI